MSNHQISSQTASSGDAQTTQQRAEQDSTQQHSSSYLQYDKEEEIRLEPVERTVSSSSSNSSDTRNVSSSHRERKKSLGSSEPDIWEDGTGPPRLERRATRAEIDSDGRRELQRIFTSASQRISRQISVAQPGDPSVDPSSDSFDLTKFLRTLRHNIEQEGIEMKKVTVVYKNLNVFGSGKALQLQKTVADIFTAPFRAREYLSFGKKDRKQILHSFDGIIRSGELCVVLGRPGSGCSTLLKSLTGELHGLETDNSEIHYNGIPQARMIKEFKGETVYNQEVDKHFPHLTVGQTLEFAAVCIPTTYATSIPGIRRQTFRKEHPEKLCNVCYEHRSYTF